MRHRRAAAVAAVLLVAAVAIAIVIARSGSASPSQAASGVPAGFTTTSVTRRTLTESSTVDGTLGYGSTLEIYDRLPGTFTWLPAVGAVIGRGGTLYRVDDLPVVLMYGSLPAYRALKLGVSDGPDVTELNRNLIALGYDPYGAIGESDRFGEATAAAVRRWQKAEGLSQTGEVQLGRVVFAPSARRVSSVDVKLGQDPPAVQAPADQAPSSETPTSKSPAAKAKAPKEPAAKSPAAKSPASKAPAAKAPAAKTPASETPTTDPPTAKTPAAKTPAAPAAKSPSGDGSEGGDGSATAAPELTMGTTSTRQIVTLALKAEQQQLARVGESAPVLLPGGRTVRGHIVEVSSVAGASKEPSSDSGKGDEGGAGDESGESATIPVTLALDHRVARLDQAPVSVELVESVRHDVLTVPATALMATAGGGYAVEALEGDRPVQLPVTPGMFADGYVEIEGTGVREGLTVIEPR